MGSVCFRREGRRSERGRRESRGGAWGESEVVMMMMMMPRPVTVLKAVI